MLFGLDLLASEDLFDDARLVDDKSGADILFGMNSSDDVFALGAYAELTTPNAKARGDIELSVASLVGAPRAFVDMIGDPGNGPYLSAMGVATELEVDACGLRLIEVVRLVIEYN